MRRSFLVALVSLVLAVPAFAALTAIAPRRAVAGPPSEISTIVVSVRPQRPLVTELAKPGATIDASAEKKATLPKIEGAVKSAPF